MYCIDGKKIDLMARDGRLSILPADFTFDNKTHFFNHCKKVIANKGFKAITLIEKPLKLICDSIFAMTILNLDKINELSLKYPTEEFSVKISVINKIINDEDVEDLLNALKYASELEKSYKAMFKMDYKAIMDSKAYKKYINKNKPRKKQIINNKRKPLKSKITLYFNNDFEFNTLLAQIKKDYIIIKTSSKRFSDNKQGYENFMIDIIAIPLRDKIKLTRALYKETYRIRGGVHNGK